MWISARHRTSVDNTIGCSLPRVSCFSNALSKEVMTLRYMGSKKWLREQVEALVPADTDLLVSPFFGSGQVEYHVARSRPQIEVQGYDLFRPVANFHRLLPVQELHGYADKQLDKEAYKQLVNGISDVDDLTSATWAYVILYNSFNGKFGGYTKRKPFTRRTVDQLSKLRLPNVHVQEADCFDVLQNLPNDRKICLYLDPPYIIKYKHDKYYRGEKQGDMLDFHQKLAKAIRQAKVPFILSINDSPEIRDYYSDFSIQTLHVEYKSGSATKTELLIHNL